MPALGFLILRFKALRMLFVTFCTDSQMQMSQRGKSRMRFLVFDCARLRSLMIAKAGCEMP